MSEPIINQLNLIYVGARFSLLLFHSNFQSVKKWKIDKAATQIDLSFTSSLDFFKIIEQLIIRAKSGIGACDRRFPLSVCLVGFFSFSVIALLASHFLITCVGLNLLPIYPRW